jgi:hypothetical protein
MQAGEWQTDRMKETEVSRTALWIVAVLGAVALGWAAAMAVQAGAPLSGPDDAYLRFGNALRTPDALERTETLVKLTKQLTPETLPGAIRAFEEDLYPIDVVDLRILMAYWAKQFPREMIDEVQGWSDTRVQRLAAAQAIAEVAGNESYEAARALYDSMPTHMRDAGLVNLVIGLIDHGDLEDLAGFVTSFQDPAERETVANVAMHRMIRKHGPAVVQTWIEGLPPGRGSSSDLQRVGFRAAQSAHLDNGYRDEFIAWLERSGDATWAKGAWRSIAVHWVRTEPLVAIEWARALPEEHGRDEVAAEAIRIWAVRDADKALEWILAQPADEQLDRGTGRLAVYYGLERPGISLALMERIISPATFQNTRRSVEHRWNVLPEPRREELLAKTKELARSRREETRRSAAGNAAAAPSDDPIEGSSEEAGEGDGA